jgi:hypothetical protein
MKFKMGTMQPCFAFIGELSSFEVVAQISVLKGFF